MNDFNTPWYKFRSDDRAWGTPLKEIPGSLFRMALVAVGVLALVILFFFFWKIVLFILIIGFIGALFPVR